MLLVVSYITQGMLFWGITLWIPLVVRGLGFTGTSQAGRRVTIAALGQILPGLLLRLLPRVDDPTLKLGLITVAMGYYASSYTPNIWSILQSGVRPQAVGRPRAS